MNSTSDDSATTKKGMEIGVVTLGEFLNDPQNDRKISAQQRIQEIVQAAQWRMKPGGMSLAWANIIASNL